MKRIPCIFLALVLILFLLSACAVSEPDGNDGPQQIQAERADGEAQKILIAYFSWAENAVQDDIDAMTSASVKTPGNVAQLASWIAEETGGDLFSVQVADRYPADWDSCLARANEEKANDIHPALVQTLDHVEDYDTVFLGYPNWWYSCPMAIHSFLDTHDLSGKQVYLFCSHGTGGLANSVNDIAADIPGAILSENVFHVYEEDVASAESDLVTWLEELEKEQEGAV